MLRPRATQPHMETKHSRFKNYHDININVHIQIKMKQLITIKDRPALYSIDVINNIHNIIQVL